jgi:hypothetical protein
MKYLKYLMPILIILFFAAPLSIAKMNPEKTAENIMKAMDYSDSIVRTDADNILRKYPGESIDQICATFDFLYRQWKYRPDPDGEEKFYKASSTLKTFKGDCDDYAIAMVSLLVAEGGMGRVVFVTDHALPEVYIGKNLSQGYLDSLPVIINKHYEALTGYKNMTSKVHYHIDKDGNVWLNLDWWDNYPGSKFHVTDPQTEHLVIYPDGSYQETYLNKKGHVF